MPNNEWPMFTDGALLAAPAIALPAGWSRRDETGWTFVDKPSDRLKVDLDLAAGGWTFFFMVTEVEVYAFAWNRAKLFVSALAKLIAAAKLQHCNCVEIDHFDTKNFLGFQYLFLTAHCRHIQKGIYFPGIKRFD